MDELIGNQTAVPYTIPIRFRVSIPLDDLLIFSAFTNYPNSLFGDLKIKIKLNTLAFVFCQVNPIISMAKYYTMNKDELLDSSQQKLRCMADLITGLHVQRLTESGLKNLVSNAKPITM
ncbi:MAG: hypothetical protein EZS28_016471 [Streblomastix strix]|uniref:Uncharacterized protein n=1 Tax=Streblomastix strix TaxID=222440 RepID=A0A5J4W065_9EUKA|nr:MAG: hypothetical protein EZS28_016471 [Streblomastix strix]